MSAPEDLNSARRRMLMAVSVKGLVVTAVYGLLSRNLVLSAWMALVALLIGWLAHIQAQATWKTLIPICVSIVSAPFALATVVNGVAELSLMMMVPVSLAVLFFDRFEVVVGAMVSGWVSNTLFLSTRSEWSSTEVAIVSLVFASLASNVIAAALHGRRLRAVDREIEADQGKALRTSETRRAQAERLAIVGRLASGVAHEINNPLAFVKANVGVLRRAFTGEEEVEEDELREVLNDTSSGIDRICQIVADLKTFAREDSGVLEPVDLRETVQGAARLAAVRMPRDMKVHLELPAAMPFVRANQRKLSQVMLNLLVNSGEALEENRTPNPQVRIKAVVEGDAVRITITDNGPGIPATLLARMFEPFFTTKAPGKGTGLGLALSREYVTTFGGTLQVHNVEPCGAEFVMTLKATAVTGETPIPGSLSLGPARAMFVAQHRRRAS
jgi:signal transduction histidine kinase